MICLMRKSFWNEIMHMYYTIYAYVQAVGEFWLNTHFYLEHDYTISSIDITRCYYTGKEGHIMGKTKSCSFRCWLWSC
jgi:hypothetical protein